MSDLTLKIYCLDLSYVVAIMAVSIIVWTLFATVISLKGRRSAALFWKIINALGCICYLVFILYFTLFRRPEGTYDVVLIPLYSFVEAQTNVEMYREMLMNIFLFLPFGMSLPFVLTDKIKHKLIITVIAGFLLSVTIEFSQYCFRLGRAEVDDVIMNTLGVALGGLTYFLSHVISNKLGKREAY